MCQGPRRRRGCLHAFCSASLSETVLITSSLPLNIYFCPCVSGFAAKKKKKEKKNFQDAGHPHSPSPSSPPSYILQSASISASLGLVTTLHLISPLTPRDPDVATSTRGNAHRNSGNYPVRLEVARPKGTKPQSTVSPRRRCHHRRHCRPQWQRQ